MFAPDSPITDEFRMLGLQAFELLARVAPGLSHDDLRYRHAYLIAHKLLGQGTGEHDAERAVGQWLQGVA